MADPARVAVLRVTVVAHRVRLGLLPADRGPEDRGPADRRPEDRMPEDRMPEDRGPADRAPEDRGPANQMREVAAHRPSAKRLSAGRPRSWKSRSPGFSLYSALASSRRPARFASAPELISISVSTGAEAARALLPRVTVRAFTRQNVGASDVRWFAGRRRALRQTASSSGARTRAPCGRPASDGSSAPAGCCRSRPTRW